MLEKCFKQPGLTCTAWDPFNKNKRIQRFMQTTYTRYTYQNELGKISFHHDMAYVVIKIWSKEQNLITFWDIKHSKFLVIYVPWLSKRTSSIGL